MEWSFGEAFETFRRSSTTLEIHADLASFFRLKTEFIGEWGGLILFNQVEGNSTENSAIQDPTDIVPLSPVDLLLAIEANPRR